MVPSFWEMEPEGVPVNSKVSVPPTMTFLTITLPSLVFVKVQVTVSPASTLKVAVRFSAERPSCRRHRRPSSAPSQPLPPRSETY